MRRGAAAAKSVLCGGVVLAFLVLGVGCRQVDEIREEFRDRTPHESYHASLEGAGLLETALGRAWTEAARRALNTPVDVEPPYREEGFLAPDSPEARGWRVYLPRGQALLVDLRLEGTDGGRFFLDLYRDDPARDREPLQVVSADSAREGLGYESFRSADYIVRVQPELLRGGRYSITLRTAATLAFPVGGRDYRAVQSVFGDPREGGRREHHGVDIFAPRGTPVVAAAEGVVSRVQVTPRGGKVVWLRDSRRSQSLYYAHLDSQLVRDGQRVRPGEVVGLIGNTGNARTTPPHLHFGIYRRGEGPVDPEPFLAQGPDTPPRLRADTSRMGDWVRTAREGLTVRARPGEDGGVVEEVGRHTPLRVVAAASSWYRVDLPDGRSGFVAADGTEPLDAPVGREVTASERTLRWRPRSDAPVVAELEAGTPLDVVGRYGGYLLVRGPADRTPPLAWLGVEPGSEVAGDGG